MKYLKKFEEHSDYDSYINGNNKVLPNVSYCNVQEEIHYNPYIRPNLCYRQIGAYYVLCGNDGKLHCKNDHGERYFIGWTGSSTTLFCDAVNWDPIRATVMSDGVVRGEVTFSYNIKGGLPYLTNNTFGWQGNNYVFSNGMWTPALPGGEYIDDASGEDK